MRTINADNVQQEEFVFPYPSVGPGYFVIRCGSGKHEYRFREDPLHESRAFRHFRHKKRTCHSECVIPFCGLEPQPLMMQGLYFVPDRNLVPALQSDPEKGCRGRSGARRRDSGETGRWGWCLVVFGGRRV
jgi:hypothetical protein